MDIIPLDRKFEFQPLNLNNNPEFLEINADAEVDLSSGHGNATNTETNDPDNNSNVIYPQNETEILAVGGKSDTGLADLKDREGCNEDVWFEYETEEGKVFTVYS